MIEGYNRHIECVAFLHQQIRALPDGEIKNPFLLPEQVYYTVFKYNSPGFIKAMRLMFHAHRLAGENQSYIKTTELIGRCASQRLVVTTFPCVIFEASGIARL